MSLLHCVASIIIILFTFPRTFLSYLCAHLYYTEKLPNSLTWNLSFPTKRALKVVRKCDLTKQYLGHNLIETDPAQRVSICSMSISVLKRIIVTTTLLHTSYRLPSCPKLLIVHALMHNYTKYHVGIPASPNESGKSVLFKKTTSLIPKGHTPKPINCANLKTSRLLQSSLSLSLNGYGHAGHMSADCV